MISEYSGHVQGKSHSKSQEYFAGGLGINIFGMRIWLHLLPVGNFLSRQPNSHPKFFQTGPIWTQISLVLFPFPDPSGNYLSGKRLPGNFDSLSLSLPLSSCSKGIPCCSYHAKTWKRREKKRDNYPNIDILGWEQLQLPHGKMEELLKMHLKCGIRIWSFNPRICIQICVAWGKIKDKPSAHQCWD